jgi:hypothetical protein
MAALARTSPRVSSPARRGAGDVFVLAAPTAAVILGCVAQWLDFRELRVPLLLIAGVGVLGTASVLARGRQPGRLLLTSMVLGMLTWAAGESVYVVLHVALGESFHAERFGPQPLQAIGLIAAHGVFLGAPTGIVAGLLLIAVQRRRTAVASD